MITVNNTFNIAKVSLTNSQVLNLHASPVRILFGQGTNYFVDILKATGRLNFATQAFSGGNLYLTNDFPIVSATTALYSEANLLSGTTSYTTNFLPLDSTSAGYQKNTSLYLATDSAILFGDGTLDIWVYYYLQS